MFTYCLRCVFLLILFLQTFKWCWHIAWFLCFLPLWSLNCFIVEFINHFETKFSIFKKAFSHSLAKRYVLSYLAQHLSSCNILWYLYKLIRLLACKVATILILHIFLINWNEGFIIFEGFFCYELWSSNWAYSQHDYLFELNKENFYSSQYLCRKLTPCFVFIFSSHFPT
jgi:hypothetical protein